jgi:phosphoglycolate phosphatase
MARGYHRVLPRVRANALFAERPFTGIVELLNDLSLTSNIVLGIATGHTSAGVEPILDTLGWRHLFVTIQTSDMAPSKPHPGMLIRAMEATGTKPGSAVFIGDTTFDMEMAKAAELHAIGVSWGHHKAERLLAAGAERIARDARELRLHIQDVVKERG